LECCACSYLKEQKRAEEYSNYQLVYQKKEQAEKEHDKQLRILKDYLGCKDCGSKEVDAYFLYKENKLVCQPCRMRKEGGSSHPISFSKQEK
jgi:formylmethanofuran dehydrogenase subunit E